MFIHAILAIAVAMPTTFASSARALAPASRLHPSTASAAVALGDSAPHKRTTFGAAIAPVTEAIRGMQYLHDDEGVMITAIQPGGAAEAAGLRAGDLLLAVDGKHVDETTLYTVVRGQPRNRAFRVELVRDGKWKDAWVTIEE